MNIYIVLINVEAKRSRETCEDIENLQLDDTHTNSMLVRDTLCKTTGISDHFLKVWPITDFMDSYNNEELNEVGTYMTYVRVPNK